MAELRLVHNGDQGPALLLREQKAWDRYVELMRKAQTSLRMEDGIAAGHAWREWLHLFGRIK